MSSTLGAMLAIIGLSGGELILFFLVIMVMLSVAVAIGLVILLATRASRRNPPMTGTPVTPPPAQSIQVVRQCPKCGTLLKSDAPEGLCPACLLQNAFGTEGGAPPGAPPFTPPPLAELAKLFPQLEILEAIGQGGMGAVYKARQPALDRFVALKILAPRSGGDLDFAGRFSREARALAKLSHPNIVAVYDYGQIQGRRREKANGGTAQANPPPDVGGYEGDLNYFIMEFVDGPNLRQVERAGKLSPREALEIIPQICAALQFAHDEGIVHRDIKPENVLLDKKGRVKIADFGLAKILGQETDLRLTGARDIMGTPHYMAPEQVEKPQEVDHRADIYSLGVVFYEMLTGELPLGKFDPPSHKVQIDVRLDDVVLRSLANNPDRRYQHVSEVKTELDSIAQTPGAQTAPRVNLIYQGVDYRSDATLFGLPLLHITSGVDPETGKVRVSKGIIAIGGRAQGVLAIGGLATGIFAFGGAAIGLFAFGGAALGLISFGGMALALIFAMGGGAIAPIAIGGGAFGYLVFGGGGFGAHVFAGNIHDPVARQFFGSWGRAAIMSFPIFSTIVTILGVSFGIGMTFWARRFGKHSNNARIVDAIRAWLSVMDRSDYARSWELAAPYFQQAMRKQDWIGKGENIRRPLGPVVSRRLSQTQFLAGGTQFQVRFETAFDGLPSAFETVTFAKQSNGDWKAVGYLIKPAAREKVVLGIISFAALTMILAILATAFFWLHQVVIPHMEASLDTSAMPMHIPKPINANVSADFHYQVFEREAATVDELISDSQRQKAALPEKDFNFPNPITNQYSQGSFKIATHERSGTEAQLAIIDSTTLAKLREGLTAWHDMLVDAHRTVYAPFWDPGMADTWSYARNEYLGGASGTLGVRRLEGRLQMRVNMHFNHSDFKAGIANGHLESQLFYEDDAPNDAALVFLVPFLHQDNSEHYLVVAYQITATTANNSPFGDNPPTVTNGITPEQQVALLEIERKKAIPEHDLATRILPPSELLPTALEFARQPPVVVETFPVSGTRDVPAGETEIRVRFSKPMQDDSWSWSSAWNNSTPESVAAPHYSEDGRTCVLRVRLEPGHTYAWWLNSETFHNFKDQAGHSAVPYLLIFQTKPN